MIGVFDSGSGGLTVLDALRRRLPKRDFLYLGDHARAPYGVRGAGEVHDFTREAVDFLLGKGCRLVVLACNTAAAVALRRLQQEWLPARAPDARILGVHVPLVEAITGVRWSAAPPAPRRRPRTVAVFATERTVASGAFSIEIGLRAPDITVVEQACPGLAAAIEANAPDSDIRRLIEGPVAALRARLGDGLPDAAALACTHYPFAADLFAAALPGVQLLTQPELVAPALADYLVRHPAQDAAGIGRLALLTTGDPERLDGLLRRLPPELGAFERTPHPTLSPEGRGIRRLGGRSRA